MMKLMPIQFSLRRRWLALLALLIVLSGALWAGQRADAIGRPELNRALLATVRVAVPVAGESDTFSTGSGTILTPNGLILTNFHVMGELERERLYNPDGTAYIAVNPPNLRGAPVWVFAAQLVRGSTTLDLAVLQVVGLLDDPDAPLPDELGLTPIPIGSSEEVLIGDEVNAIGFPSLGQSTVTFTNGTISGFLDENDDGVFDWFKTDTNISRGNSGGLATDAAGNMIGIPTAGFSDSETASKISLIRPVDLAIPLLRAATNQSESTDSDARSKGGNRNVSEGPRVSNVRFATAINRNGEAINPNRRFEETDIIYAVFDYADFSGGAEFEFVWYQDGFEVFRDSDAWGESAQGSDWVNIYSDDLLPDGFFELELLLDGESLYRGGFVIGDAAPPQSDGFSNIIFAEAVSDDGAPIRPGTSFSGVDTVYAVFDVNDLANGTVWERRWYVEDEQALSQEQIWDGGDAESWWVSINHKNGLPPAMYRLDLLIEGEVVASAEFEVTEDAAPRVQPVTVIGTIVSEDNRRQPIEGATVLFIQAGIPVDAFIQEPDESVVVAAGVSDAAGDYQLDSQLIPGETYGVVVFHQDYRIVAADDYQLEPDAVSPWRINVSMKRR